MFSASGISIQPFTAGGSGAGAEDCGLQPARPAASRVSADSRRGLKRWYINSPESGCAAAVQAKAQNIAAYASEGHHGAGSADQRNTGQQQNHHNVPDRTHTDQGKIEVMQTGSEPA